MNLNVEIERHKSYAVVRVSGRAVRENQAELRDALESTVASGLKCLALDLGGVSYMDSAALGCCASVQKSLKQTGDGCLVVFNASPDILKVWKMIRLDLVIPVVEDEAAAVARFGTDPAAK